MAGSPVDAAGAGRRGGGLGDGGADGRGAERRCLDHLHGSERVTSRERGSARSGVHRRLGDGGGHRGHWRLPIGCGSSRGGSHRACKLRVTMCASATCTSRTTREGVIDVRSLFRGWEDTGGRGVPFGVAGGPARLTERPIHETRFFGGNSAGFISAKHHVCSYMTRLIMINELRTRN